MFVYLLKHATEPRFKIGKSNDIRKRIARLGGFDSFNIDESMCVLLPSDSDAFKVERMLHWFFNQWNLPVQESHRYDGDTEQFSMECFDRVVSFLSSNSNRIGGLAPIASMLAIGANKIKKQLRIESTIEAIEKHEKVYSLENGCSLNAWLPTGKLIGTLSIDQKQSLFCFDYANEWVAHPKSYPLSPHLPFDLSLSPEIRSTIVVRYLNNLLPEGKGLEDIARMGNLSKSNLFGLLRLVGKESSSAMMLLPSEIPFPTDNPADVLRHLPFSEVSERIRARASIPFAVWDSKVRLSVAGYQDKIGVLVKDDQLFLAEHPLASTHILKPMPMDPRFTGLVANEHFCMRLSAASGLATAKTSIIRLPEPALLIKRFDRTLRDDASAVARSHIIDGCQALDLPSGYKNERNFGHSPDVRHVRDGVSLKRLFDLGPLFDAPILFKIEMLRWTLMQYLLGNTDAHGKNISFHVGPSGLLRLAPSYDLVCTTLYPDHEEEIAMSVGDEFRFVDIGAYQWAEFAGQCEIPRRILTNEMSKLAKAVSVNAPKVLSGGEFTHEERIVLNDVVAVVLSQAVKMKRDADMIHSGVLVPMGFSV